MPDPSKEKEETKRASRQPDPGYTPDSPFGIIERARGAAHLAALRAAANGRDRRPGGEVAEAASTPAANAPMRSTALPPADRILALRGLLWQELRIAGLSSDDLSELRLGMVDTRHERIVLHGKRFPVSADACALYRRLVACLDRAQEHAGERDNEPRLFPDPAAFAPAPQPTPPSAVAVDMLPVGLVAPFAESPAAAAELPLTSLNGTHAVAEHPRDPAAPNGAVELSR